MDIEHGHILLIENLGIFTVRTRTIIGVHPAVPLRLKAVRGLAFAASPHSINRTGNTLTCADRQSCR